MIKQEHIIQAMKSIDPKVKITQPRVSRIINEKEEISFPFAVVLNILFPEKTIPEWKKASGKEFEQAFSQLEEVA